MNALDFEDVGGNRLRYTINYPQGMNKWSFDGFIEFMELTPSEANDQGFMFSINDNLRHERFRYLVNQPDSTLNTPLVFIQNGERIVIGDEFSLNGVTQQVGIHRAHADSSTRHCQQAPLKERHLTIYNHYEEMLVEAIDKTINKDLPPEPPRLSFLRLKDEASGTEDHPTKEAQLEFLLRAAMAIHRAPFENWSKFNEAIPFRNGYEMWLNYLNGGGGVCSEKTASLKFLCDVLGLESRPVIGTQSRLTDEDIDSIGDYFLSNGDGQPPFDIKHLLLEVDVNGESYLIDATGGNVPMLFLNGIDAEAYFKAGYSVRMLTLTDKLYLHRVPAWIGDAHLLVCEYHLPDVHFDLTFEQDLGLEISGDQYVAAFFDYGGEHSDRLRKHFEKLGTSQKLDPPIFINKQTNQIPVTDHSLNFFQDIRASILQSYPDPNYTGDFTIVLQPLRKNFWRKPIISKELAQILKKPLDPSPA